MIPLSRLKSFLNNPRTQALASHYAELLGSPYYTFRPRPDDVRQFDQQTSFVRDNFPGIACVLGGTGSGKSYAAAWKVVDFLYRTPPPRPLTPFWVISQTHEMSAGNNWLKNLSTFLRPEDVDDVSWLSQARNLPRAVKLRPHVNGNAWTLEFHSYDMDRRRLQGYSLGGFWCDELCPYSLLMEVWGRCRDYDFPGSKLYTLTPIVDGRKGYTTYELEEIYKSPGEHPDWRFYRLNSRCNTALAEGFVDRYVANEVEDLRETRLTGAFAGLSGQVYKSFSDAHVCQPVTIPDDWYHLRGIDFGWSHATVCLWLARNHAGTYYVYHEYVRQETTLDRHVDAIKSVPWGTDPNYWGNTWADYAAAQERADFARLGVRTDAAKKDVLPGIAAVQKLLREGRLYIFNTCKHLIREMKSYSWSKTQKDKVDKQDDDAVDALRYALYTDVRTWVPPPPPRSAEDVRREQERRREEFLWRMPDD